MKPARIIVLLVAIAAGGVAALLAGRSDKPAVTPEPTASLDTLQVLVARSDIPIGHALSAGDVQWQAWPKESAGPSLIRKADRADAAEQVAGALTRTPFAAGEPIREDKLIKANGSGFMAAILPSGKRALATEVSPETGAGGFILPNDRVDVILTRRERRNERDYVSTETVLTNIRVLAIDQTVEEKNGARVVIGKVATLEVAPGQTEALALARGRGVLSLALRSLADAGRTEPADDESGRQVNVVRFGASAQKQK
jgi:pilus assembly protein CpaB